MSAAINMAAMFPPTGQDIWNENLLWQPVPVHIIPFDRDYYLQGSASCPRFDQLLSVYNDNATIRETYKELLEYIEVNSETPMRTLENYLYFYENLLTESQIGLKLVIFAFSSRQVY